VASATGGGFLVAWNRIGDGEGTGVFARVYDVAGNPIGAEFMVNTYTLYSQLFPAVAADASGRFVVVWSSYQDGGEYGVFGQRFNSAGGKIGGEFQVNSHTEYTQGYQGASVSAGAAGDFVVAWSSYYQDGYGWGVFAQRFDAAGAAAGTEFQVNTYTVGHQGDGNNYGGVVAAKSASGSFVITWASAYQDGSDFGTFARHYDNAGVPTSPTDFQVNNHTLYSQGGYGNLGAAGDGSGRFVVAWTSYDQDGDYYGVFARRIDNSGALVGSEFQVNTYTPGPQGFAGPAVAADAAGAFLISWAGGEEQDGFPGFGIFGQRFLSDGTRAGVEFQSNTYELGHQWFPTVSADWGGCSAVVWRSGVRPVLASCTMDTDCPKYPIEICVAGMCDSVGQQDGFQGGIFGQRYCESRQHDHYKCYKVKDRKMPPFVPITASLTDQFVSENAFIKKPFMLCAPVDKNGEGINDPAMHQCCYLLKPLSLSPSPLVEVASQFQMSRLSVLKSRMLCAPCTKTVLP
jgi:hypothetical protein